MSSSSQAACDVLVKRIATTALAADVRIAVAESLTGGSLSNCLASGDDAAEWFRGGVVAYNPEVKFEVLGVEPGPVNSQVCALQMARGAVKALGAEIAVAATGVGGPGPDEGVPSGTVFLACADWTGEAVGREIRVEGPPSVVVASTVIASLELLAECLAPTAPAEGVVTSLAAWRDCRRVRTTSHTGNPGGTS